MKLTSLLKGVEMSLSSWQDREEVSEMCWISCVCIIINILEMPLMIQISFFLFFAMQAKEFDSDFKA